MLFGSVRLWPIVSVKDALNLAKPNGPDMLQTGRRAGSQILTPLNGEFRLQTGRSGEIFRRLSKRLEPTRCRRSRWLRFSKLVLTEMGWARLCRRCANSH